MELLTPLMKALPLAVPEDTVVKIAKDMCVALELCRKHGIIHPDIKPQNIFVSPHGDYKLGDFGIAKTVEKTMGGTKIGTYKFMAPEVYNNQPYGMAADVCSLGLVLYWLLNERRMPFLPLPPVKSTAVMEETARERRFRGEALPPPAHGSEKLKQIVLKACAFDPKERYQTAAEMLADLNAGEASAIPEPPKPPVENHPAPVEVLIPNPQTEPEDAGDKTWTKEQTEKVSDRTVLIAPEEKTPEAPKEKRNPAVEKMEESAKPDSRKTIGRMKALRLFSVIAALIAGTLFWGYFNVHFWTEATCPEDSVCKLCGKEQTAALGHKWTEATCTEGSVCKLCGEQQTAALGHGYENGICSVCGDLQLKILDQPDSVIAEYGDYIVFHVEAVGEGICYQWYEKYNNEIVECGDKKDTHSFYNNHDRGKKFFCIITDKYGNSVQTNTVIIMEKR